MSSTTDRISSEECAESSTVRLKQDIEQTREDLSDTVAALEERFSPAQLRTALREEVQEAKGALNAGMQEAKEVLNAGVREAKEALNAGMIDAERLIRSGLHDAKETVKNELKDAVTGAKDSLRAATVGRVENVATKLGDTMNDARDSLLETISNNPIPAALTGVGIAWLLMNRSRTASNRRRGYAGYGATGEYHPRQMGPRVGETVGHMGALGQAAQQASSAVSQGLHGMTETAGEMLEGATGTVTNLAHTAAEGFSQAAHTVTDSASALAEGAQARAKRVEQTLQRQLQDRPLAIGAAAVALGTMVGCSLPRTRGEDELMGEARDRVLSRAGDAVHEGAASVARLAREQSGEGVQAGGRTPEGQGTRGGQRQAHAEGSQGGQQGSAGK